ncbi:hypothetical protein [uncultured Clostridium sp.]|uniref:hypothetical protein n=1 Tax=uncultured Clostridium sp. TaxID=59620 RepID=UPI00261BA355|nr:hypothetical protein [uncultured Clostridium sp.]
MFDIKIGDKLRIDEFKREGIRVVNSSIGKVIKEYDHHFSLKGVNYIFSINKNSILDNSLHVSKIRTNLV